ncbi:MAG: hypothetical protein AAF740_07235 [Bacteroidota bacterium]
MQLNPKNLFRIAFVLVLCSFTMTTEDWRLYTYRSGNFRVQMPGTPETHKERVMTIKAKSAGTYYMVSYNQLDNPVRSGTAIRQVLIESAEEYRRSLGVTDGENIRGTEITVDGLLGREYYFKTEGGVHIVYRIVISNNRLYQFNVMRVLAYPEPEKVVRFFDSFEQLSR